MTRNLMSTIEFSRGQIMMRVVEKIAANQVVIFARHGRIKNAKLFLEQTLKAFKDQVGGTIKEVNVILERSPKVTSTLTMHRHKITTAGRPIDQNHLDQLHQQVKSRLVQDRMGMTLLQPLQFEVQSSQDEKRIYKMVPLGKVGTHLHGLYVATHVDQKVLDFVHATLDPHGLKVKQVFMAFQTLSHAKLSSMALNKGATLIDVGDDKVTVTINKNGGTIGCLEMYGSGFNTLQLALAKRLECSLEKASDIFHTYGTNLTSAPNALVYLHQNGLTMRKYYYRDVQAVMITYLRRILAIANKYLQQKKAVDLPIVFSGKVEHIHDFVAFATNIFATNVSIYTPLSYIETNYSNNNVLGTINISQRLENTFGENLETVVQTNPNLITSLNLKKHKRIFSRILKKGGKYEWKQ